jgi:hypothetical protein
MRGRWPLNEVTATSVASGGDRPRALSVISRRKEKVMV